MTLQKVNYFNNIDESNLPNLFNRIIKLDIDPKDYY